MLGKSLELKQKLWLVMPVNVSMVRGVRDMIYLLFKAFKGDYERAINHAHGHITDEQSILFILEEKIFLGPFNPVFSCKHGDKYYES